MHITAELYTWRIQHSKVKRLPQHHTHTGSHSAAAMSSDSMVTRQPLYGQCDLVPLTSLPYASAPPPLNGMQSLPPRLSWIFNMTVYEMGQTCFFQMSSSFFLLLLHSSLPVNRLNVCASLPTPPPKSCIEALTSNIIVLGVGPLGGS